MLPVVGYNRYPDEKGTERSQLSHRMGEGSWLDGEVVTTVTPMKRGLKAMEEGDNPPSCSRYNRYPDEKGTESCSKGHDNGNWGLSYNRYPDEKGTERRFTNFTRVASRGVTTVTPMKRGLKALNKSNMLNIMTSYNRYPDEKGTERWYDGLDNETKGVVTTVTPMKRGLKVCSPIRFCAAVICYNRYPDEKGTESRHPLSRGLRSRRYNRYPDEKGTERTE